ncbi:RNA polymerase sigma factor [Dethiobacter alkaliphilus]|uniref:RNA polymerase sigma factor n=1 Tax=Dethiobacter alkaliphilus TaxID=427926 RepID=UPI002227E968|nr:RNA polymerase sigma factor [Dethiobacter alkaliphilus]MCW3489440.1 RNA polymerase sigma factor [Dethiobacter alkaliphilus]
MSSYQRVFEQYYNHIKKLMVLYCCNTQQAEDFTQEAFYRAFKNIDQLREPEKFKSWVYQIAVNEARKYYNKNEKLVFMDPDTLQHRQENITEIDTVNVRMHVSELLYRLDNDSRAILILHYFEDLPINEIARILDIKEGTVKSRLHRARVKLRTLLDAEKNGLNII